MDYIQGEKFLNLVDNNVIFYKNTTEVNNFLLNFAPKTPFILITHNSDGAVEYEATRWDSASFKYAPKNLIKWFGQNIKHEDPKLISLPIGLENSKWFPELNKIKKLFDIKLNPKQNINLIYSNFNIETNLNERLSPFNICKSISYATTVLGKNGLNYDSYLYNLYNHEFVLCPPGNGEDTHRLWETLYVGSIPIVKKSINTSYYSDLPICFIETWEQLKDINFLTTELNRIKQKKDWNLDKLNFSYWANLIKTI